MRPVEPEVHVGEVCTCCGRHCRVPVVHDMPREVVDAYMAAGLGSMATCEEGAAAEQRTVGASYADVIAERLRRIDRSL